MTKGKVSKKSDRKEPQKSLKEKRADKLKKRTDKKNDDKIL
jgi:hypothetical protein